MSYLSTGSTTINPTSVKLPFVPEEYPRENARHYISASAEDVALMLKKIGLDNLGELFDSIPQEYKFDNLPNLPDELAYQDAADHLFHVSSKSDLKLSFLGDSLPVWQIHPITEEICRLRPLSTSYTPYQPERSQGTLVTHWLYQCVLSSLTGFEAINTSLYDRAAAIFEAIGCAKRSRKRKGPVLLADSMFDSDLSFLQTHANGTDLTFCKAPLDPATGLIDLNHLKQFFSENHDSIAAFVFPQVNHLGLLEKVDELSDLASQWDIPSIGIIDPMLIVSGGLKPPTEFGKKGVDFIAGEAQHLALNPSFGGPGLGLFGCRYNETSRTDLRNSPGRYVGKAKDSQGRDCFVMVLSTREQHIRKEKATSNVCSNQAFLATIAAANLLAKGENGLKCSLEKAVNARNQASAWIRSREGIGIAFPNSPALTELVFWVEEDSHDLLEKAHKHGLHLGHDVSSRIPQYGKKLFKVCFSDMHDEEALDSLKNFLF